MFFHGLAATRERNLHPALHRPRLTAGCRVDEVWLRVERQILAALPSPAVGGVFFAIRIELSPLQAVLDDPSARLSFAQALTTMDDAVAQYKGLLSARPRSPGAPRGSLDPAMAGRRARRARLTTEPHFQSA